jgi:hypothetical protein
MQYRVASNGDSDLLCDQVRLNLSDHIGAVFVDAGQIALLQLKLHTSLHRHLDDLRGANLLS